MVPTSAPARIDRVMVKKKKNKRKRQRKERKGKAKNRYQPIVVELPLEPRQPL